MLRKIRDTLLILAALAVISGSVLRAQNLANGSFAVSPTFSLANCETSAIAGMTTYCPLGNGQVYYCLSTSNCSTSTAAWVPVAGPATPVSLTLNNTTKNLPASFTIAVTQGTPVTTPTVTSVPAPIISAQ